MPRPPQPAVKLADLPWAASLQPETGPLVADAEYDRAHFGPAEWDSPDGSRAILIECALTGITITGGRLRQARLTSGWLSGVTLTGTDLARTSWIEAVLERCALGGTALFGSALHRVVLRGCKLDAVNLRDADLTDVRFENCLLRDADFGSARLTRTVFDDCKLTRADFTNAELDQVDLRTSELDILAGPQSLRGAIITPGQLTAIAPALAAGLGIIVEPA